jgi:hypothetical protein
LLASIAYTLSLSVGPENWNPLDLKEGCHIHHLDN